MDPGLRLLSIVVIFLVVLPFVYWRLKKERDPEWERRWGELPLVERKRLIQRARRGETSTDPGEAQLIAGSARHQRSVRRSASNAGIGSLVVASVLVLAALAKGSLPMIGLALVLLGVLAWLAYRDRALDRRLASSERYRP
jgi:Flp pilus assembly protein TadB